MFGISTSIDTIDSTSPTPVLKSTASLIETKGIKSQCPNIHDTESQSGEKEIDGNTSQKNLSQVVLARHALETKRVELVGSMSAFIVQGNSGKTIKLFPKELLHMSIYNNILAYYCRKNELWDEGK